LPGDPACGEAVAIAIKKSLTDANGSKRKHLSMSREPRPAPLGRCALVWLATLAGLVVLAGWLAPDLLVAGDLIAGGGLRDRPFDEVLVWLCEAALLGAGGWLWVVTALVARDAARGHGTVRRGVPAPVRRLVLLACGAALAGGLAPPSYAAPAAAADRDRPAAALVEGLPLPDRTTASMHLGHLVARRAAALGRPGPADRPPRTVVVGPGDTLWGLADATLAPGASASAVSDRWHRIYRANRAVIGADPDLIQPEQRLRLPRR
jgi:nucleoid-associated protein YgaU